MLYIECSKKGAISLLLWNWRRSTKLKSKNKIKDDWNFENATYNATCKRHNITASFSKHLEFLEIFTHEIWVGSNNGKSAGKIYDSYRVLHERSNITSSLQEHLAFPKKWSFTRGVWVVRKWNQQKRFNFNNTINRVFHERRNISLSFAKHLAFAN